METPVLLLVYNRPKQTKAVLDRLQQYGISNLFVSADGPKNVADKKLTDETKTVLIQFDSIIKDKRISAKNSGCKNGVVQGISWFFDRVDEGIILEDDCLPSEYFFPFMVDMLNRYRDERKVMMIGGNNPQGVWQTEGGHIFSRIGTIWGWATWKDCWQEFNPELPEFNEFVANQGFELAFGPTKLAASRIELTRRSLRGDIDTWDYQWNAHMLMNEGLAIIPEQNLVENIGFNSEGTNFQTKPNWVSNAISAQPIAIEARQIEIDREFEMEWELARRSGLVANASSFSFQEKGASRKQKLKILLINSTDVGGGAEKIAFSLHQKLLEIGHESLLLVQEKKSELDHIQEIRDPKSQIGDFQPDVIHVHNLHGTSISLNDLSDLGQKIPVLFTLHDPWIASGSTAHPFELNPARLNLLELRSWKQEFKNRQMIINDGHFRFTAPSQWMRELLFNAHGIWPFFVRNAVALPDSDEVEIPSERYILFVANRPKTNPYKDFATLKNAWKKANEKMPGTGFDLVVLGGGSETEKVGNHSIFVHKQQSSAQVCAFMENSLLVVQASLADNAPLSIIEAHAAGKKVLGPLVGGIPELLDAQERSWMYEAENVNDFSERLVQAVSSVTRDKKKTVRETMGLERMTNTYLGHYFELTIER